MKNYLAKVIYTIRVAKSTSLTLQDVVVVVFIFPYRDVSLQVGL